MITTATYILAAIVNGEKYIFEYKAYDPWAALQEFWHEDYPKVILGKTGDSYFPIDVYSMLEGKVMYTYKMAFDHANFHAFFDKGHKADGIYTLDEFAEVINKERMKMSILERLTKATNGTDKELYTEEERDKFAEFYVDKWDENTSEDVIAEAFTDYWWETDKPCRRCSRCGKLMRKGYWVWQTDAQRLLCRCRCCILLL